MRSTTSSVLLVCLAAALALPTWAGAQTIPSPYVYLERAQEGGPFSGYLAAGTGRFGFGPSGGPSYGARYAVEVSGPLSIEGVAGLVRAQRDVVDPGRAEGDRVIGQADILLAEIDARFRFSLTGRRSWHRLSPYLAFGGGVVFDAGGKSDLDAVLLPEDVFSLGTSFVGTTGLGSRLFLSDHFALSGEGVFSLWQIDTPPGFSDPERAFEAVADHEWVWGTSLSVSLLYRW